MAPVYRVRSGLQADDIVSGEDDEYGLIGLLDEHRRGVASLVGETTPALFAAFAVEGDEAGVLATDMDDN